MAIAALAAVTAFLFLRPGEVPRSARAGFTHDPPYMYAGPDGRPRGLSVDVVSEAARRAGLALDWVQVDARQADEALRTGRVDVWPGLTVVPHREREFFFSDHWLQTVVWVVVRDNGKLPGPDFAGDVGVAPLPITEYVMRQHFPRARLVHRADGNALARDLCAGRLSVALVAAGELARVSTDPTAGCASAGLRAHVVPESTLRIAVAARRGHEASATRIRAQIDQMAADGSIATMVLPYSYHAASEILAVYQLLQARSRARWLTIGAVVLSVFLLATLALLAALYRANRAVRRTYEEKAALEDKLHAAERLELVGQLAGGVAHDFNNLVTVIVGYSDLAAESAQGIPGLRESLDEIRRAGDRATELVQQLLTVSGRQAVEPRVLALHDALTGMQPMLRRVLREDITLRLRLDAAPDHVRMDPGQLSRVLLNLTLNAADAMPEGGRLTIGTATDPAKTPAGTATVRLWFEDSGVGMRPEVAARAFEPFFTTKGPGRGTGLGLASVHGIVTQAGGEVHLRSVPDEGTRFDIRLPLVEGPSEHRERVVPQVAPVESRTLLVVEDRDDVRDLVVRILESAGHRVIPASDGVAALDVLRARQGEVALVLTDMVMPGLSGPALYQQAQAAGGPIRFLFISGYSDDAIAGAGHGATLLPKPFTPAQLVAAVSTALLSEA